MLVPSLLVAACLGQAPEAIDAGSLPATLALLTDGRGHYVAYDAQKPYGEDLFYGDGKAFARVPVVSGGQNGTEQWGVSLWDPRARGRQGQYASVDMQDSGARFSVRCGERTTPLKPVKADEAKPLLGAATFTERVFTRLPERLLRDDDGTYYFVDRYRSTKPGDRRDFRVFVGPRGNMKQVPLKDLVDDSEGMIFSTRGGNLRLITSPGKEKNVWVKGKDATSLTVVPLDTIENGRLVYVDLGPYSGLRLGTPCDDLM